MKHFTLVLAFLGTILLSYGQCNAPVSLTISNVTGSGATVGWTSGGSTTWQIEYGPKGFVVGSGTKITTTLNPYNLTGISGATEYHLYVRDTCTTDSTVSSWQGPIGFTTLCSGANIAPVKYDFEGSGWVKPSGFNDPGKTAVCWSKSPTTGFQFAVGPPTFDPFNTGPSGDHTTGSGKYIFSERINPASNTDASIRSPRIDISNLTNPELTFWYHMFGNQISELKVEAKDASGSGWTVLTTYTGPQQTAKSSAWKEAIVSLKSLNADTIFLRFSAKNSSTFGQNSHMAVDDVSIHEGPTCPKPSKLDVVAKRSTSITLTWLSGGASHWEIEYGPAPFTPGNGTRISVSSFPHKITGLSPNTTYRFYVRDSCGVGDVSAWSEFRNAKTECAPITAPFKEDFNSAGFTPSSTFGQPGKIAACWSRPQTTGFFWDTGEPPFPITNTGPSGDHTTGSGNYLFTEMIGFTTGINDAEVKSKLIDLSPLDTPEMTVWVHMFGIGISGLDIEINNGTGWKNIKTITGQQQSAKADPWKEIILPLVDYIDDTVQLKFIGKTTMFGANEIAIDDFEIYEQPSCPKPDSLSLVSASFNSANIQWSTGGASNWLMKWKQVGGTASINSVTNNPHKLTGLSANTNYEVWVRDSCSAGDVSRWIGPLSFRTTCAPLTAPYAENFDGSSFKPAPTWNTSSTFSSCYDVPVDGIFQWEVGPEVFPNNNSGPSQDHTTGSGQFVFSDAKNFLMSPDEAFLITPYIDISALKTPEVEFWYHMFGSNIGALKVDIDNGSGWASLGTITGQQQTSKTEAWKKKVFSLSTYLNDTIRLRFNSSVTSTPAFNVNVAIDDLKVREQPTCPDPTKLELVSASSTSINFKWVTGGASNWLVKYKSSASPTIISSSTNPHQLQNLTSSTTYEIWVKDSCKAGDVSEWIGPLKVKTSCAPNSLPFTEDFDGTSWTTTTNNFFPGNIDDCWNRSDTTNYYWKTGDGVNGTFFNTGPSSDNTSGTGKFVFTAFRSANQASETELTSPWVDLSNTKLPTLDFYYHMFGISINYLEVFVEQSNGTKTSLKKISGEQHTSATDSWTLQSLSLSKYLGDTVRFVFEGAKNTSWRSEIAIDDFEVYDAICADPANIVVNNITATSADVSWDGSAQNSFVQHGTTGFSLGSGTTTPGSSPVNIVGLLPNTTYDVYVKDSCDVGNSSNWIGPITFTTLCEEVTGNYSTSNSGLDVTFDASSVTGTSPSYTWDFGDGNSGTGSPVNHLYATAGIYVVQLYVLDVCGNQDTISDTVKVCDKPVADFTFSINGNTVNFDGTVSQNATTYSWDFGNGIKSSISQPIVTYASKGQFTITLIVTNECGEADTLVKVIDVCPKPTAAFNYNVLSSGGGGMKVAFDATSSVGGVSYKWDFGDGNTATGPSVQHTYTVPGLFYTVTLIVESNCGTEDTLKIKLSDVFSVEESLLSAMEVYPNPVRDEVYLENTSVNWEEIEISLYNSNGKLVGQELEYTDRGVKLNVQHLSSGTYFIQVHWKGAVHHIPIIKE